MERTFAIHPPECPLSFFLDNVDGRDSWEEEVLLLNVFDISIDQQRVCFRVYILHGYLETIETSGLRDLHCSTELLSEILEDNAVGCCEESQDVFDEVLFFGVEFIPVIDVLIEIDLVDCPEGGQMFFIHVVDWGIVDAEEDKAVWIFGEDGFFFLGGGKGCQHE